MSIILKLNGTSSTLSKKLNTPIYNFSTVACVGFYSTFLTPNVTLNNNKLYYEHKKETHVIIIPPGQYNIENLEKYIQSQSPFNSTNITIKPHRILSRIEIKSGFKLNFDAADSIGSLLGFQNQIVKKTNLLLVIRFLNSFLLKPLMYILTVLKV